MGRRTSWVCLVVLAILLSACDWTTYQYGPAHTGFNSGESTITTASVSGLVSKWTQAGPAGDKYTSPVTSAGTVFVAAGPVASGNGTLYAYDTAGSTGCSGSPTRCAPLWTANLPNGATGRSPAVADGRVYMTSGNSLHVFDAAGTSGCSGSPKTCSPLWTATLTSGNYFSGGGSPVVSDGVVFVTSLSASSGPSALLAFDASGASGCTGSPVTCAPLWTAALPSATTPGAAAVANGNVYVGAGNALLSFSADGGAGCAGTPKTCAARWTALLAGSNYRLGTPAVAGGVVYVSSQVGSLYAVDAAGATNCSGSPVSCAPLWRTDPSAPTVGGVGGGLSDPAIGYGAVYVQSSFGLLAFDSVGVTGCSGVPKVCSPTWWTNHLDLGYGWGSDQSYAPVLAGGIAYSRTGSNEFYAYEASGPQACTGSGGSRACTPLKVWVAGRHDLQELYGTTGLAVAGGTIYLVSAGTGLMAYGL